MFESSGVGNGKGRTEFVTNPCASCETADSSGCEHGGGVAFVFLLFFFIGCGACGCVVVALVTLGVAEQAALVMACRCDVRCAGWRWSIGTWR